MAFSRHEPHRHAGQLKMSGPMLYLRYAANCLRAQMLYPTAFLLRFVSQFLVTITEFGGLFALFARFGHIGGWHFAEIALFYGAVSTSFALAEMTSRGFEMFGAQFVRTGDFDRVLLRPRSEALQLAGFEFGFTSIGRVLQAILALGIAIELLPIGWGLGRAVLLLWSITGGFALFWAILILQATLAFWTVEGLEVTNTITYGGVEAGQYPLDIYAAWFRKFLLFVVPIGCVSYLPIAALLGRAGATGVTTITAELAPAAGFLFLGLALTAWRYGIAHYTSTGS
jgi:viologen exporter family transport system permease protein